MSEKTTLEMLQEQLSSHAAYLGALQALYEATEGGTWQDDEALYGLVEKLCQDADISPHELEEEGGVPNILLRDTLEVRAEVGFVDVMYPTKFTLLLAFGGPQIEMDLWADGNYVLRGYWWGEEASKEGHIRDLGKAIFENLTEMWQQNISVGVA